MPGEIQPVDFCIRAEALLPIQLGAELEALLVAGREVSAGDIYPVFRELFQRRLAT